MRKELDALDLIALGKLSTKPEHKFGANLTIPNGATEDLWGDSTLFVPLTANTQFEILSSAVTDNLAGVGAHSVKVWGVKADWTLESETIDLHATVGTTPVDLAETYMGIYRLKVMSSGSSKLNVGKITVRVKSAGAGQGFIEATYNQSTHGIYPVPKDHTILLDELILSTNKASGVNVKLWALDTLDNNLKTVKRNFQATGLPIVFKVPLVYTEKTWLIWEATNGSGTEAFVSVEFNFRIVKNGQLTSI